MKIFQKEIRLKPLSRGFHLITGEIESALTEIREIKSGVATIFIKHTSASLAINENADPSVRYDLSAFFDRLVPDGASYFTHTTEGSDDMPAHVKVALTGSSLTIPISSGSMNLGTWQGVYLCEHRDRGGSRRLVVTLMGE